MSHFPVLFQFDLFCSSGASWPAVNESERRAKKVCVLRKLLRARWLNVCWH